MPDVTRSGSALIQPTGASQGYSIGDLEMAKFRDIGNGTVALRVYQEGGGASGYTEGTTIGTANGNVVLFRGTLGTLQVVGTANPLPVSLQTLIAGEDLTNNVLKVEQRFTGTYISAAGTNTIKTGAGFVHSLLLGSTTAAAGTIYDATGTSSSILWSHKASLAEGAYPLNITFSTGLTYANPGTPQVTISYR